MADAPPTLRATRGSDTRLLLLVLLGGIALVLIKSLAFALTGSSVIFVDAMEGLVNVAAALIALRCLRIAMKPADDDHPYGHGKVEFISALTEGAMIAAAALATGARAAYDLYAGVELNHLRWGAAITALAMAANGLMGWMLVHVGRRRHSLLLEADGKHLLSDALSSVGALAALAVVGLTGWLIVDPIAAMIMSLLLLRMGLKLIGRSYDGLMDRQDSRDEALLSGILDSRVSAGDACSWHKLRHRHSGRYHWVDFHLMVHRSTTVTESHRLASAIEHEMETALGEADATAHIEPCDRPDCPQCHAVAPASPPPAPATPDPARD